MSDDASRSALAAQTFCHQCHMKCPVQARVRNGVLVNIKGSSCPKGRHAVDDVYRPDRLRHPLKRVGERGEGKWRRISWDEALDTMAEQFASIKEKYGPDAIFSVTGCFHKENAAIASLLFGYLLETPNVLDANHLCSIPDNVAQSCTLGDVISTDRNVDYRRSKCILLWGANPPETRPPQAKDIFAAKADGAKLIVVDPRPTKIATRADLWLRVRPGADAALALGMLNTIIERGLYDRAFVDKWCVGFEALRERAKEYPVDKVSELTWVPQEQVVEAATMFASIKPACIHTRLGIDSQHVNATQAARATTVLLALSGNIDVEGGNLLSNDLGGFMPIYQMRNALRLPVEVEMTRYGATEYPLSCGSKLTAKNRFHAHTPSGVKAMLKHELRAGFIPGNNTILEEANSRETWEALKSLEFLVVVDLSMTPTAELADIVLPAAHWLETESPTCSFTGLYNSVMATRKVIEPVGECWDDRRIVLELARRMEIESPWQTVDDLNDLRLQGLKMTFKELQNLPGQAMEFPVQYLKYEGRGFKTPSGKIELYSSIFEKHGYDPLPYHREPPESPYSTPELAKAYPMIMIQARHRAYEHTEYRNIPALRKLVPEPQVEISPEAARAHGINEGDEVWLESSKFSWRIKAKARFVHGLHPSVVSLTHGWWFPERTGPDHGCFESNANAIISNDPPYDPINGNYQVRAILCRIGKTEE